MVTVTRLTVAIIYIYIKIVCPEGIQPSNMRNRDIALAGAAQWIERGL